MSALRVALLRRLYRIAWHLLQLRSYLWPHRGRGVKCLLTHRGRVLLVRHTYGPPGTWYVPGGGAHRRESAQQAAAREMQEELGVRDLDWHELITREMRLERFQVRLTCLYAELPDPALVRADPVEIAEVGWFTPTALPTPRGGEVGVLLALLAAR